MLLPLWVAMRSALMPPQAARTVDPPRTRPRRRINRAKRATRPGPLHSPEGHTAPDAPNPRATVHEATGDPPVTALIQPSGPPEVTAGSP